MKIFNWVHRKINYKDGITGNENKNGKDSDKHILLEENEFSDMLNGWKGGILTIGTFGFDPINIDEKEYLYRDEEDESDVSDESEEEEEEEEENEDQESNPLMHATYAHEFEGSTCDNPAKDTIYGTIDSDCDMNMKKQRITLADLFYADSDEQEKYKKSKGKLFEQQYHNKKLSAPESNYKRGRTFAKKLVPRVGEDSRPIKKLHQLMTRILKRKIHPDIGVKINKDNHQNAKPKVAFEDGKIYESISLLQYQDVIM